MSKLKQQILDRVAQWDAVTFAELEDLVGFKAKGLGYELIGEQNNIVIWSGATFAGIKAVTELVKDELVWLCPIAPLVYAIDGGFLALPIAQPDHSHKVKQWLPCALYMPESRRIISKVRIKL